jgi:hypothetical protein
MFGDVGLNLIALMGRRKTLPGVIEPKDIPEALRSLRQGAAAADAAAEDNVTEDVDSEDEQPVSLRNRATPLIELLEAAHKENVPVVWEEGERNY